VKLALALPKSELGNHIREPHVKRGAKYLACGFTAGFWLGKRQVEPLLNEAKELTSIFVSSRRTIKNSK